MVGWCSMGTFNDPCFPSRFPAGSQQVGLSLRTTGGRVVRLGGGLFGPRGDRGSCAADAQLAAAAGGLARWHGLRGTVFTGDFWWVPGDFWWWVHGISKDFSVKNGEFWGFKYERWWVHGDLTWFNHEQWGFIRIWPWQIVISWDFMGFSWLSWWIQLQ